MTTMSMTTEPSRLCGKRRQCQSTRGNYVKWQTHRAHGDAALVGERIFAWPIYRRIYKHPWADSSLFSQY